MQDNDFVEARARALPSKRATCNCCTSNHLTVARNNRSTIRSTSRPLQHHPRHHSMASTSLLPRAKPWETAAAMDNPGSSSAVAVSSGDHASGSGAPELPDRPGDMQSLTTTGGMAGGMNAVGESSSTCGQDPR